MKTDRCESPAGACAQQNLTARHRARIRGMFLCSLILLASAGPAKNPNSGKDGHTRLLSDKTSETRVLPLAIANPSTAQALAQAMDIDGADLISADLMGSDPIGTGVGDAELSYFPTEGGTFALLSTGNPVAADRPNEGFFFLDNRSLQLNGLKNIQGGDVVQLYLKLAVPPGQRCLSFDFAFYSEEFPEWLNSQYNDAFTAEKGGTDLRFEGIRVESPLNFAFDQNGNTISVNTAFGVQGDTRTIYDGATPLLKAQTPVEPESVVELYLTIQDVGDHRLDSTVFLDNLSWSEDEECRQGAVQIGEFLPPIPGESWTRSIRVDSNMNGRPDPDDEIVRVTRNTSTMNYLTFESQRWGRSTVELGNPDPQSGQPGSVVHRRPQPTMAVGGAPPRTEPMASPRDETTVFTIDGVGSLLRPASFSINQVRVKNGITTTLTGSGVAEDTNGDGKADSFTGEGTHQPKVTVSLVYTDVDGDGNADFGSIPWSLAQVIGVNTLDAIPDPQVWVPLGDTNGDGVPDSPAFDFNHDNKPDPDLTLAPMVAGPDNPAVEHKLYFAQFGDGSVQGQEFVSQILLFALDSQNEAHVDLDIRDAVGDPFQLMLNDEQVNGQTSLTIPAGGLATLETSGEGSVQTGSVVVTSDCPVAGVVVFDSPFGVAGVGGGSALSQGFVVPVEINKEMGINTGFAVMNLEDQLTSLHPELYDAQGQRLSGFDPEEGIWLEARGQVARFVTDLEKNWWPPPYSVNLEDFKGFMRMRTSGRIAATVIQTRPGEYATQPVLPNYNPLGATGLAALLQQAPAQSGGLAHRLHFAHFGNGAVAGIQIFSQILLFNLDQTLPAQARVLIRDDLGIPLSVRLNGEMTAGEIDVMVPAGGMGIVQTDGEGVVVQGAVTVLSDRGLAGNLLYGGSAGVAGVGRSEELIQGFVAPMETKSSRKLNTGVAIKNLADHSVTLDLELYSFSGVRLATATQQVAAGGHRALFVGDFSWTPSLDLTNFLGLMKVGSRGERITATVIQTRPNQFATLPVAPWIQ